MRDGFRQVPVNRFLGLELVSRSPEEVVVSMRVTADHVQEAGLAQGGILSGLADTAAIYLFWPDLDKGRTMTSIEFKMNFLRPVRANEAPVIARSSLLRRGRRVGTCEVTLTQGPQTVAKGVFTYLFLEKGPRTS